MTSKYLYPKKLKMLVPLVYGRIDFDSYFTGSSVRLDSIIGIECVIKIVNRINQWFDRP